MVLNNLLLQLKDGIYDFFWIDGFTSWQSLRDIKDSFPIEAAEYTAVHNLTNEPAFKWWVSKTLRHRNILIKKMNTNRRCTEGSH